VAYGICKQSKVTRLLKENKRKNLKISSYRKFL